MEQLTDSQINIILNRIIADGVTDLLLRDDLMDHYCCFIEEKMGSGCDFETAYALAFVAITPNGMREIQEELFFLLNFKKQTNMKRIIYGSGFFAAFLISSGLLFKTVHWEYGTELLFSGFCALLITSTAFFINAIRFKKMHSSVYYLRVIAGFLSAFLTASGSLFKMLRYPGANLQIIIGMTLLNLIFIPMFFYHLYKQSLVAKR